MCGAAPKATDDGNVRGDGGCVDGRRGVVQVVRRASSFCSPGARTFCTGRILGVDWERRNCSEPDVFQPEVSISGEVGLDMAPLTLVQGDHFRSYRPLR